MCCELCAKVACDALSCEAPDVDGNDGGRGGLLRQLVLVVVVVEERGNACSSTLCVLISVLISVYMRVC